MNRRVTFNANDEETASNAAIPPPARTQTAPPTYTKFTPGGRLEFLKDIEAYQAACLINKVVDIPADDPAPAYALHDFPNAGPSKPTDDKEIFRANFQKKLCELKEFIQRRPNGRLTKTGLSEKAILLICAVILVLIAGFVAAWVIVIHQIALLVTLAAVWVATLIMFCYTGWRYYNKRKLLNFINVALLKVDNFERLDDRTVEVIKKAINHAVPASYWVDAALAIRRNQRS
ncbi:uncharacterized protein DFL_008853 [Arthrobotrys flagrans]|uniref:Uncharacterized protein n=1 Tax=Arthrobotrys flagrans TaxID=97331 RepID=A0A436ZPZ2_ARTFL|nr:hypothetical protein DFL_008853 [Arthrobotrys flagrans]